MYYIYILFSHKDSQLYTGYTDNLKSRYKAHVSGFVKATKHRRLFNLYIMKDIWKKQTRDEERYT